MLSVDAALAIVLDEATLPAPVATPLTEAQGRVLAASVTARDPLPPFPSSVKDGYAVVAADGPGDYPVLGAATAGHVPAFVVRPGTVAYITTGAPMPPGADAVVMVEETESLAERAGTPYVRIRAGVRAGADVRPVGYDVADGELVLPAGTRLGSAEIGLLATVGATTIQAYGRPRIGVLSSGDELVDPNRAPGPGQIRDSNRATLMAAARAAGGEVIDLGIAGDSQAELEERVHFGLQNADVVLTSGGVSMGDLDFVKPLLERTGTVHFGRLRMKPGKPCTFATVFVDGQKRLVFGLPGNPVSSLVTFYLLGVPAIRKLSGWPDPTLRRVQAYLGQDLALDPWRPEYHRATLRWDSGLNGGNGGFLALSTGNQASSRLISMRSANALLLLPQAEGVLTAGATVTALLIGDDFGSQG